ncbi:MAG: BatA domain-containing protein [Isosphaeraceae bacterium]|nr:BatA domain-containing protein [Isosphaeraceae bacterium]
MNFLSGWRFPLELETPLGLPAWAALAAVPAGIIALYFLKLRRRPIRVPSTLLWRRSLEDLHVNSLFQRLRKNLLLFLQLLVVALAMFALAGPRTRGAAGQGARYVIAIDNSASMSATDVAPSRLEDAKAKAKRVVDSMGSSDLAMVIAFSDRARVVSLYTGNRQLLNKRIDEIEPTESSTTLRDALQVAAGLANPSRQIEGVAATSIVPPKLLLYTDGGFPDVEGFSLGNLEPEVIVIGTPPPPYDPRIVDAAEGAPPAPASNNISVAALQTRRSDDRPDVHQVFGRVHNHRDEDVKTQARLMRLDSSDRSARGTLIDAVELTIAARGEQAFKFDLPETGALDLMVELDVDDDLPLDNRAYTLVAPPRKAQVLVVTTGNRFLIDAFETPTAKARAEVRVVPPPSIETEPIAGELASGRYDLVIYDGVRPKTSPQANTLMIGVFPPGSAFESPRKVESPEIVDVDTSHPLMQYIRDLSVVTILEANVVDPPAGSTTLIDSKSGPLAFTQPRESFTDCVLGFGLTSGTTFNTDWVTKYSFPIFLFNVLQHLGGAGETEGEELHAPGRPVALRPDALVSEVEVRPPGDRASSVVKRSPRGEFVYNETERTGIYGVSWKPEGASTFAVNLFDPRESDLAVRGLVPAGTPEAQVDAYRIKIGYSPVAGSRAATSTIRDWWWVLALGALAVVVFEWYVYNRRVYI